jgi:CHAT domain-containing protein
VVAASWAVKDSVSAEQLEALASRLPADGAAGALAHAQRASIARIAPPNPRFWAFYAAYGGW